MTIIFFNIGEELLWRTDVNCGPFFLYMFTHVKFIMMLIGAKRMETKKERRNMMGLKD